MPRIDPHQLLTCLGVLLTPNGGIKSKDEVQRLSSLMTKFSKKLVSKCVYILILKNTDTELLGQFMSVGGWNLTHLWLTDGICNNNWPLVSELLELMLMCPVDVERLKANNCPKLVKGLSKEGGPEGVRILASKLVEQWLKVVKGEAQVLATAPLNPIAPELAQTLPQPLAVTSAPSQLQQQQQTELIPPVQTLDSAPVVNENNLEASARLQPNHTVYKVTVRDGKQLIAKVDLPPGDSESGEKDKKEQKEKSKHSSSSKHSSKSSSSSNSSRKSSSRDKSKDKERDRSKGSSRDKDRDSSRSNGALKKSSSHSSSSHHHSNKEKQAEKDKATLAKLQPQSLNKIGRIPKKQSTDDDKKDKKSSGSSPNSKLEAKKTSISIEVRKRDAESRPKTVKIFNSKMRSTGLEEEAKPAPPRPVPKKLPSPKRMSPMHEKETTLKPPPEKKPKYADLLFDRPGGVKHIEPKTKPVGLQECGLFMDAMVAASTTNKKDPKKKKRRMSVSKEDNAPGGKSNSPPHSPPVTPSTTGSISPATSPVLKTPIPKFYKDTLETDDESDPKSPKSEGDIKKEEDEDVKDVVKDKTKDDDGPKSPDDALSVNEIKTEPPERKSGGVLVLTKRKGPKKTVSWKNDSELEVIQYFELDETERVNVTKTFTDMKQIEMSGEREAVQLSRKLPNEDMMDERMLWRKLIPIDVPVELVQLGKNSKEKDIQHSREKVILQALYFHRSMIPDSPTEPDVEHHPMEDAVVIPLDDVAGNPDSVKDYTMTPWPETKGEAPTEVSNFNSGMPNFTAPIQPPFIGMPPPGGFPPGMPGPPFPGPQPGFWRPPGPDMNMNPEMFNRMGMPPPGMFHGGQPTPNGFGMPPNGPFPPPQAFNGPPGMFPPGAPHFTERGGHVNMRMGNRNGMWFRKNVPKKWKGVDWNNTDVCKHFQRIGYCRQGDKCQFLHPGVNCPPFD